MTDAVLFSHIFEKKRSLDQLIEESKASSDFYLFLSVSAIITTFGLISANGVVVIGGMLVAPILYPILSLSMAVATSSKRAIIRSVKVLFKAVSIVFIISLIAAVLFHDGTLNSEILLRTRPDLISFLIALAAGVAASFGWVRQQSISSTLAGIAVSVSLIPPLAVVGIGVAMLDTAIISGAVTLFIINLLGILMAGIAIFNLFGFSSLKHEEEKKIVEEKVEEVIQEKAKEEERAEESLEKEVEEVITMRSEENR